MTYARFTALAKRLIGKGGKTVTVTRHGTGTADVLAGRRSTTSKRTGTFKAVGFPPGKGADKEIGSLLNRNLIELYLSKTSSTFDPEPGDVVPWGTRTYTVIWAATYDPDASGTIFTKAYAEAGG